MFFTQDDYKKIQQWLIKNSVKDTEFNEANIPFNGEETITIVQGNQNKKVFLKDLIAQVFNLGISDFVNITDKYDAPNISLEEAIRLIPSRARKEGQVITFLDREDHWHIYQFKGALNQWNVLDTWEDLFDWEKLIIDSILPDEEDLTKSPADENGNSYLSLKDREYNPEDFSGLGRIILRKNIVDIEDPIYGKVKKNVLYQDMFTQSNTVYEIRYDFDLNGEEITIPEGCVLDFQGGIFSNGTIIGSSTIIDSYEYSILGNCKIKGTWVCGEANTLMFNTEINDNILFENLGTLARVVRIYNNREYFVDKKSISLYIDKFYSIGEKPVINFLDGSQGEFNNNLGFYFISKNLIIENIKFTEDFKVGTPNDSLNGSALGQDYPSKTGSINVKLINCEFTGDFSSSCFASAKTTNVEVNNCIFHDCYLCDHAVYSSVNSEYFRVKDCKVENILATTNLFKVRESPNIKLFEIDGLKAINVSSYIFQVTLLRDEVDRDVNIYIKNVNFNRIDNFGLGVFGLLNTEKFDGQAKVSNVCIENCTLYGGEYDSSTDSYNERPILATGSGKGVSINTYSIKNSHIERFGIANHQNNVNKTIIDSSYLLTKSSFYHCNDVNISNSKIEVYIFLSSLFNSPKNIFIYNTSIIGSLKYLCVNEQEHSGENYTFSLNSCKINNLSNNIFDYKNTKNPQKIYYEEINCDIVRGDSPLVSNISVSNYPILNIKSGDSTLKEREKNNELGYQFFDTTINSMNTLGKNGFITERYEWKGFYFSVSKGNENKHLAFSFTNLKSAVDFNIEYVIYAAPGYASFNGIFKLVNKEGLKCIPFQTSLYNSVYNYRTYLIVEYKQLEDGSFSGNVYLKTDNVAHSLVGHGCVSINKVTSYPNINISYTDVIEECDLSVSFKDSYSSLPYGTFEARPENPGVGYQYFCTDRYSPEGDGVGTTMYYKGNNIWVDSLGRIVDSTVPIPNRGGTDTRPIFEAYKKQGFQYFDTTINKPIWWIGTKWVDATGADV